ncbi:MAG: FAD-dependent monooxygenase, partial [Pseudomonadota bacterium]
PKAGQGMNVSMGDGFNLGWKLAGVLRGHMPESILLTYSAERQGVAQDLIDFDREWSRVIRERNESDGDTPEFQRYFTKSGRYTAGMGVRYAPSILTGEGTYQDLAKGFEIGTRFHSAPVIRAADGKRLHLGHVIKADGRWRLFAFEGAGGLAPAADAYAALVDAYGGDVFDLCGIYQTGHHDLDTDIVPAVLRPPVGRLGLTDYEGVFCPDLARGDVFDLRGVDRTQGAMVVVRPDQYVAHLLPLGARDDLADFFAPVLL